MAFYKFKSTLVYKGSKFGVQTPLECLREQSTAESTLVSITNSSRGLQS